ncbi:MAG TPA: GDP-mannose 4,6-dehydratase, partial [Anaerolineae bacterium]|nr:GDP-mannose 4,6-dehydratase [Anaerolineae bacterium]
MRNLLITGGAGFIGSNYVRYVLQNHADYHVTVFDKLTYAGNLDNLLDLAGPFQARYRFVRGDICDAEVVNAAVRDHHIDTIVNFAAESHVDRSLLTPDAFVKTDVNGTYVLLEAAKQFQIERYHQVSTDEVYGDVPISSSRETDPLQPRSPYSASKASGDLLVQAYHVSFGVPTTITRGSNTYGPYQYPE